MKNYLWSNIKVLSCLSTKLYELGPKIITSFCKFKYTYDRKVPPVILDGGKEIANCHGPRLPWHSNDGGLAQAMPQIQLMLWFQGLSL